MATTIARSSPTGRQVRIGVLVPSEVQLLDLACVDVFAMLSHNYLAYLKMLPASLTDLAPDVTISYVGLDAAVPTTAGTKMECTHRIGDADVAPGKLDIVLVPGPDPFAEWGGDVTGWLRGHAGTEGTDVLCVCTGIFLLGEAGLLKGRTAAGPRGLQKVIGEKYEGVRLVGDRYRWVRDGNVWTSGELSF
jgi:transcriptional regulator GlxA family with amidase domain